MIGITVPVSFSVKTVVHLQTRSNNRYDCRLHITFSEIKLEFTTKLFSRNQIIRQIKNVAIKLQKNVLISLLYEYKPDLNVRN